MMSGFVLKLIALSTMVLDHIGAAMFPQATWMRVIGRIAFPVYIFLMAEGCEHTRSLWKYALRLFLFALISEIPYDFALHMQGGITLSHALAYQNVFFTLFLGVLAVALERELRQHKTPRFLSALIVIPCAYLAFFANTDYDWLGVAAVFVCAQAPGKWYRLLAVGLFVVAQYVQMTPVYLLGALVALGFIALYNGQRGPNLRIAFYAAYPAHLAVLALLQWV